MNEYLPLLLAVAFFPLTFLTKRIPARLHGYLLLALAGLFVVAAYMGPGSKYPYLFFAILAAGWALRRFGLLRYGKG